MLVHYIIACVTNHCDTKSLLSDLSKTREASEITHMWFHSFNKQQLIWSYEHVNKWLVCWDSVTSSDRYSPLRWFQCSGYVRHEAYDEISWNDHMITSSSSQFIHITASMLSLVHYTSSEWWVMVKLAMYSMLRWFKRSITLVLHHTNAYVTLQQDKRFQLNEWMMISEASEIIQMKLHSFIKHHMNHHTSK